MNVSYLPVGGGGKPEKPLRVWADILGNFISLSFLLDGSLTNIVDSWNFT